MVTNLGYGQGTSLGTAKSLGSLIATGIPSGANRAILQAQDQGIRWRDDGVAPTASVGMLLANGDIVEYDGNLHSLLLIETTASAKLNVTFYKD